MEEVGKFVTSWCNGMWAWMTKKKVAWITIALVSVSVAYSLFYPSNSGADRFRYAGTTLQLLGVGAVAIGIEQTRKLFGLPSTFTGIQKYFVSAPLQGPQRVTGNGHIVVQTGGVSATGSAGSLSIGGGGPSLEHRLVALEVALKRIDGSTTELYAKLQQEQEAREAALEAERKQRQAQANEHAETLRLAQTGGLNLSLSGLILLWFGVVMASIPSELARLFNLS